MAPASRAKRAPSFRSWSSRCFWVAAFDALAWPLVAECCRAFLPLLTLDSLLGSGGSRFAGGFLGSCSLTWLAVGPDVGWLLLCIHDLHLDAKGSSQRSGYSVHPLLRKITLFQEAEASCSLGSQSPTPPQRLPSRREYRSSRHLFGRAHRPTWSQRHPTRVYEHAAQRTKLGLPSKIRNSLFPRLAANKPQ